MDQYYHLPLNLKSIAQEACFSHFHFLREFHKTFGKTPHQYLIYKRIGQAKHLIKNSDLTITEICYKVGFESLGSFSCLFRKLTTLSPSQYRKEWKLKQFSKEVDPIKAVPGCFLLMRTVPIV